MLTVEIKISKILFEKIEEKRHVIVKTTCVNQNGEIVAEGKGKHKILSP